jgi:hypothetical protein
MLVSQINNSNVPEGGDQEILMTSSFFNITFVNDSKARLQHDGLKISAT